MTMREEFEAWLKEPINCAGDTVPRWQVKGFWEAFDLTWQAAYRAGAESMREAAAMEMVLEGEHLYAAQIRALPVDV